MERKPFYSVKPLSRVQTQCCRDPWDTAPLQTLVSSEYCSPRLDKVKIRLGNLFLGSLAPTELTRVGYKILELVDY